MLLKQSSGNKWTQKKNWYTFLTWITWSYLQMIVMWKLLIGFSEWNPSDSINNGNGL